MKKQFINPAMRVIKFESNSLMLDASNNQGDGSKLAPERQRLDIFGDSEF